MLEDRIFKQEQDTAALLEQLAFIKKRIENNLDEFEIMHKALQRIEAEITQNIKETNNNKLLQKIRDGVYKVVDATTNQEVPVRFS